MVIRKGCWIKGWNFLKRLFIEYLKAIMNDLVERKQIDDGGHR